MQRLEESNVVQDLGYAAGPRTFCVQEGSLVARSKSTRSFLQPFAFLWGAVKVVLMSAIMLVFSPLVIFIDLFFPKRSISHGLLGLWYQGYGQDVVGDSVYVSQQADKAAAVFASYTASGRVEFPFQTINCSHQMISSSLIASVINRSHFKPTAISTGARGDADHARYVAWSLASSQCNGTHNPPACSNECIFVEANLHRHCVLRSLIDRFDGDMIMALAAYNAGASKVYAYDEGSYSGVPPIRETRSYVQRIVNYWSGIRHSYTTFNVSKFLMAKKMQRWLIVTSTVLWTVFFIWIIRKAGVVEPKR